MALGINQIAVAAGFVIGPVLGGLLTAVSWRWIFWINVPFGIIGTIWGIRALRVPVWLNAVYMILMGGGSGLFNSPNTNAIMQSVSPQCGGDADDAGEYRTDVEHCNYLSAGIEPTAGRGDDARVFVWRRDERCAANSRFV